MTPFTFAVQGQVEALIGSLPSDQQPWQIRNAHGESLILFCLYRGLDECLEPLLTRTTTLPLHEAAALGRVAEVEALLKTAPWSANLLSPDGWTALHLAAYLGRNNEVLDVLLAHGADPETASRAFQRNLPLHAACAGRNEEAALLLADLTYNVDWLQGPEGSTALMIAAENGMEKTVVKLLARGADARREVDGKSAASMAREQGYARLAELIERAAGKSS